MICWLRSAICASTSGSTLGVLGRSARSALKLAFDADVDGAGRLLPPALAAAPISVPSWSMRAQTSVRPIFLRLSSASVMSALTLPSVALTAAMPTQTILMTVVLHWSPCDWMRPQMLSRPPRIASRHLAILIALPTGLLPLSVS